MAILAADMESCNQKSRCLTGPNEGQAYDPENPCGGLGVFDETKCDCVQSDGCYRVTAVATGDRGVFTRTEFWTKPPNYFAPNGDAITFHFGMLTGQSCDASIDRQPCDCPEGFCEDVTEASLTLSSAFCANNPTYDGALLAAQFAIVERTNGARSSVLAFDNTGYDARAACDGLNPATYEITLEQISPLPCE